MFPDLLKLMARLLEALMPVFDTGKIQIKGIGTGAAYAAGDAFGAKFAFEVPKHGDIENVIFYDLDDEGIAKTLPLFNLDFTATNDNDALSISDNDMLNSEGHIEIEAADFRDFGASRLATVRLNTPLRYTAPSGQLYCQMQTQGTDNIAAGSLPHIRFKIRRRWVMTNG